MHGTALTPLSYPVFMSILAAERQQQILERLGRDGRVVATALAEAFATSEDTIRRDLRDLAGRGLCRRVYGGALPVSPASRSAQIRAGEATDRKAALGRALAGLVASDSLLFVDSGSRGCWRPDLGRRRGVAS
jgi:DeoR/GlpR family transcriptional regulator of sugar metabolism